MIIATFSSERKKKDCKRRRMKKEVEQKTTLFDGCNIWSSARRIITILDVHPRVYFPSTAEKYAG